MRKVRCERLCGAPAGPLFLSATAVNVTSEQPGHPTPARIMEGPKGGFSKTQAAVTLSMTHNQPPLRRLLCCSTANRQTLDKHCTGRGSSKQVRDKATAPQLNGKDLLEAPGMCAA